MSLLTDATPLLLDQLDAGEDILLVFRAQNRWLFVCETSLRLVRDNKEVSRLDFPDVILEAYFDGPELLVRDVSKVVTRTMITNHSLELIE